MVAEIAAHYILSQTSAVTTLVGGTTAPNPRIYLGRRRQTTIMPSISIELDGVVPTDQKPDTPGASQGVSHLDTEDILVFSYGNTWTEANTLSRAVRTALDKKVAGTYNSIVVQSVQFLGEDYFDEDLDPIYYVFEHRYRLRIIR
ncbi:MAG TPA: hypothetical protein PK059_02060 [Cyclobacteriaceae bacterium]|nr:hypothetical protein [Cyclobacteriaceae bacterium]